MHLQLYSRFIAVVEAGSINKAALNLNVSQPAVTKSIQQLEERYGVPLLERGTNGIRLTECGKLVFNRGKLVEKELRTIREEIDVVQRLSRGKVAVGAPPGLGFVNRVMAQAVKALLERSKLRLEIELVIGTREELLPALNRGELDLMISTQPNSEDGRGLSQSPLAHDRDVMVVRAQHPLARTAVSLKDLFGFGWAYALDSRSTVDQITAAGENVGLSCDSNLICSTSIRFIRYMLSVSDLVGFVPNGSSGLDFPNRNFVRIQFDSACGNTIKIGEREICVLYRNETSLSTSAATLLKEIKRASQKENEVIPLFG